MLINVPSASELNETALRLYFGAWQKNASLVYQFMQLYEADLPPWDKKAEFGEEWDDYLDEIQSQLGAIAATAQHSAELRLKSIICDTSPYILLLKSDVKLKASGGDIDFSDQRTLDAAELPMAVRTLTPFHLSDDYIKSYTELRRLRNRVMHIGSHQVRLAPLEMAQVLIRQYLDLWPDKQWLVRRVKYDSDSASNFFNDGRYFSTHSTVFEELPTTLVLFDNTSFRKCAGTSKSSLKGHCPLCKSNTASKSGSLTEPTVARVGSKLAKCYMCDADLEILSTEIGCWCGAKAITASQEEPHTCCFKCGAYEKQVSE